MFAGKKKSATGKKIPVSRKKLRFDDTPSTSANVKEQGNLQDKEGAKSGKVKVKSVLQQQSLLMDEVLQKVLNRESEDSESEEEDDNDDIQDEEKNTANDSDSSDDESDDGSPIVKKTTVSASSILSSPKPVENLQVTTRTTSATSTPSTTTPTLMTTLTRNVQPRVRDSRKTSKVWNHFNVTDDWRCAQCIHCKRMVSRGRTIGHLTTTNMKYHLEREHKAVLLAEEAAGKPKKEITSEDCVYVKQKQTSPSPLPRQQRQATVEQMGWCPSSISQTRKQVVSKVETRQIAVMIAVDDQPLQIVENDGFQQLIHLLAPDYKIPSRTTFTHQVIPSLYSQCRAEMQIVMARAKGRSIHLTTDLWTSKNATHAYLSLTAHWWQLDEALTDSTSTSSGSSTSSSKKLSPGYRWALLHAQVLDQRHTSENILQTIQGMMEGWKGLLRSSDMECLNGYIITDNAANMNKALEDGGFKGIQCFALTLHLVVRDALGLSAKEVQGAGTSQALKQLIEKCRKIAGHFNRSVKSRKELREKQIAVRAPLHNLVQDVPTRWNSTYLMLERLSEQQTPLHDLAMESEIGLESPLECQDWTNIAQTVHVLKPFKEYTDELSAATATLGDIIPVIYDLEQVLEEFLHQTDLSKEVLQLVKCLKDQVQKRLKPLMEKDCYMLATMCDPRVKGNVALKCNTLAYWKNKLIKMVEKISTPPTLSCSTASSSTSCSPLMMTLHSPPKFHQTGAISKARARLGRFETGGAANQQQYLQEKVAEIHVKNFLSEPVQSMESDPLRYWAEKASMWPYLTIVAQHFLSCPPTSVQSERVFSLTGNIVSPHRARLNPDLVEELVFIKMNLPLLENLKIRCDWEEE